MVYVNGSSLEELNEAQLQAWECGCGYFYWSYKLLIDSVHAPAEGLHAWNLGRCKAMGWLHRN